MLYEIKQSIIDHLNTHDFHFLKPYTYETHVDMEYTGNIKLPEDIVTEIHDLGKYETSLEWKELNNFRLNNIYYPPEFYFKHNFFRKNRKKTYTILHKTFLKIKYPTIYIEILVKICMSGKRKIKETYDKLNMKLDIEQFQYKRIKATSSME